MYRLFVPRSHYSSEVVGVGVGLESGLVGVGPGIFVGVRVGFGVLVGMGGWFKSRMGVSNEGRPEVVGVTTVEVGLSGCSFTLP